MEKRIAGIGWLVAVIAFVAALALGFQMMRAYERAARLDNEITALKARFDAAKTQADEAVQKSKEEIDGLHQQIAEIEDKTAKADAPGLAGAQPASAGDLLAGMLSALKPAEDKKEPGSSGSDAKANPMAAMAKMFQGEAGEKVAALGAGMAVDMAYQDLFKEWNLPKDTEAKVREMFRSYMAEQIKASIDMGQKGFSKEAAEKLESEGKARLREQLATVLTPEEMARWEEYESTLDERILEKQYDMQLGMLAPGLTPENRELVRDVLVEEFLAGQQNPRGVTDIQQGIDMQVDALERTRTRLAESGQLDEAQLAEVDKFVTVMGQQMEMARAMFGAVTQNTQPGQDQPTPSEETQPQVPAQGQ